MAEVRDAAQLRQLTAHFDALPGAAPAPDARCAPAPWADPRPDLAGDHGRWNILLALAWALDGADPYGVFGALHGIRCCGAALVTAAAPRPDPVPAGPPLRSTDEPTGLVRPPRGWRLTRGELTEPEWQAYRARWLWPHREVLTKLLRGGSQE